MNEVARYCTLPESTAAGIISRLRKRGVLCKAMVLSGRRGRPVATYQLKLPGPIAACQFDGSQLAGGIFDDELKVRAYEVVALRPLVDLGQAVSKVRELLGRLSSAAGMAREDLPGLALAVNAVQLGQRTLVSSVLPWAKDAFEERLAGDLGMPVKLVLLPGLLAEFQKSPEPIPRSLVKFKVGDGVSAHAVLFGRIHHGHSSLAGELGHVTAASDGPLCGCGRRGCLEAYCSGGAIHQKVLSDLRSGVVSHLVGKDLAVLSARDGVDRIWQTWREGDTYVRSCMEEVLDRLGWGLGLVMNLIDPEVLVIGGYVLQDRQEWIDEIVRRSQRWTLHAAVRKTRIVQSQVTTEDELRMIGSCFYYEGLTAGRSPALQYV